MMWIDGEYFDTFIPEKVGALRRYKSEMAIATLQFGMAKFNYDMALLTPDPSKAPSHGDVIELPTRGLMSTNLKPYS